MGLWNSKNIVIGKNISRKRFEAIIDNEDAYRFMIRRLRNKESYKEINYFSSNSNRNWNAYSILFYWHRYF